MCSTKSGRPNGPHTRYILSDFMFQFKMGHYYVELDDFRYLPNRVHVVPYSTIRRVGSLAPATVAEAIARNASFISLTEFTE